MPAETHVGRDRLGPDDVLRCVRFNTAEVLELPDVDIALDARLVDDLGADELALIDLVEAIEEELGERTVGFAIADDDLADVATVADLVEVVSARLERAERNPRSVMGEEVGSG
ncbi:MAG: acyl carrier protein [Acidimicrobiia bacterium]